jgi:hypothetical protein
MGEHPRLARHLAFTRVVSEGVANEFKCLYSVSHEGVRAGAFLARTCARPAAVPCHDSVDFTAHGSDLLPEIQHERAA